MLTITSSSQNPAVRVTFPMRGGWGLGVPPFSSSAMDFLLPAGWGARVKIRSNRERPSGLDHAHERKVAVLLRMVQPVSDHELLRTVEPHPARLLHHLLGDVLVQQRADFE